MIAVAEGSRAAIRVEWVTDRPRFDALREPWERLTRDQATPFADFAWFSAWWHAFGGRSQLRLCVCWRGDEMVAVLPLHTIPAGLAAMSNYHTPLLPVVADCPEARQRLARAVLEARPGLLGVHGLAEDDPFWAVLRDEVRRCRRTWIAELAHSSPIVETAHGDFAGYLRVPRAHMRTLLRRRRKAAREHHLVYEVESCPGDLDAALLKGFEIEASGWKSAAGTAVLKVPEALRFYREVADAYQRQGRLRLAWLYVDGQPAAFNLCLERGKRLFLLKTAYFSPLQRLTPGLLLNLHMVEHCFEHGLEAYELLGAEEPWKLVLANARRQHLRVWTHRFDSVALPHYLIRRLAVPVYHASRAHVAVKDIRLPPKPRD